MKPIRSTLLTCALLTFYSSALAQTAPAPVTAPSTADEYSALMDVAVHAAQEVAAAETAHAALMIEVRAQVRDRQRIEATPCVNPVGSTTHCAAYDARIDEVNERRERLLVRGARTSQRLGIARSNFGMAMARLRIMAITAELEAWRQGVITCTRAPSGTGEATGARARACLQEAWGRLPGRLVRRTGN